MPPSQNWSNLSNRIKRVMIPQIYQKSPKSQYHIIPQIYQKPPKSRYHRFGGISHAPFWTWTHFYNLHIHIHIHIDHDRYGWKKLQRIKCKYTKAYTCDKSYKMANGRSAYTTRVVLWDAKAQTLFALLAFTDAARSLSCPARLEKPVLYFTLFTTAFILG